MKENKVNFKTSKKPGTSSRGIFAFLERNLRLESYFEEGFPVAHLPKIMFALALGIIYISNSHYTEQTVRKISNLQAEVEDLRADYTTLKANLMFASKQSEVAKKVAPYGLHETLTPPYKIVVEKGEY